MTTDGRRGGDGGGRPGMAPPLVHRAAFSTLEARLLTRMVGGKHLVRRLLIALLADGHVLLDGAPGLAKTRAVTVLAEALEATFRRVVLGPGQWLPHLLGSELSTPKAGRGLPAAPFFANILLADGIDRASPEARLTLLDAMTERQVVVDGIPMRLPDIFLVCATRTLISTRLEVTPLAADERDRFLLHIRLGYPDESDERQMLALIRTERVATEAGQAAAIAPLPLAVVIAARASVQTVRAGPRILRRITALMAATREGNLAPNGPARWILSGAGPRGSIALDRCARAHAWLAGRQQVTDRDVAAVVHDVLRHRIELSDEAKEAGVTIDAVIDELLAQLPVT
jgi:MoxR-like ATPase